MIHIHDFPSIDLSDDISGSDTCIIGRRSGIYGIHINTFRHTECHRIRIADIFSYYTEIPLIGLFELNPVHKLIDDRYYLGYGDCKTHSFDLTAWISGVFLGCNTYHFTSDIYQRASVVAFIYGCISLEQFHLFIAYSYLSVQSTDISYCYRLPVTKGVTNCNSHRANA